MSTLSEMLSLRKQRLSLQREADLLEEKEKKLNQEIIMQMVFDGVKKITDGDDEAVLIETVEPVVDSWPVLLDYIRENDALDMLQKRVTASAIKARWADKVAIPGVSPFTKQSLKFNI